MMGWKSVCIICFVEFGMLLFDLMCLVDVNMLKLVVCEGVLIKVFIGDDVVLIGYVEMVELILMFRMYDIWILGCGKLVDLIDCFCCIDKINVNMRLKDLCMMIV